MKLSLDQLSPRHKQCLRLVYTRRTTKEIARELGIAPGTAATYISEAITILGAADRRRAAELLQAHETPPAGSGAPSEGLVEAPADPSTNGPSGRPAHPLGPLAPANRDADNDSSITTRLGWIILIAVGLALGFGSLASAVRTFSDIAGRAQFHGTS